MANGFVAVARPAIPAMSPVAPDISNGLITARDVDATNVARSGKTRFEHLVDHTSGHVNVKSYGVTQAGIQAAIDAAPAGGIVLIPDGAYAITSGLTISKSLTLRLSQGAILTSTADAAITVSNVTGVHIEGGKIVLSGTGANLGSDGKPLRIGINPVGTVTDLTIEGVEIQGNAVLADAHRGVFNWSGQTLTRITIRDNYIHDVMVAVSVSADSAGDIRDIKILHNRIVNCVGTVGGTGYGIHTSNGSGNPSLVRIEGNYTELCQRHDIYSARGSGVSIVGNHSKDHKKGVAQQISRAAIAVERTSDVTVVGNVIEDTRDGAISVIPDDAVDLPNNITVANNVVTNWRFFAAIQIGTPLPSTQGIATGVIVSGNVLRKDYAVIYNGDVTADNDSAGTAFQVYTGKRVNISHNSIEILNAAQPDTTPLTTNTIVLVGSEETAGTSLYSDRIRVAWNTAYLTGGTQRFVRLESAMCAAASALEFIGNNVTGAGLSATFVRGGSHVNANIYVDRQEIDGLDSTRVLRARLIGAKVSAERSGSVTLQAGVDAQTQRWIADLTNNRVVTLSTTGAVTGDRFRIVRAGLGNFSLDVGGLKTIPKLTTGWVDVEYDGAAWAVTGSRVTGGVSGDRGGSVTLQSGVDPPTQQWIAALTNNRAVTLSTTGASAGDRFHVLRLGLGAFALDVGGLFSIPASTAGWADVEFDGAAWVLVGYALYGAQTRLGQKASWALGTVGAAGQVTTTQTVTGAVTTGAASCSPTSTLAAPLVAYCYVSSADTVTLVVANGSAAGVAGGTVTFNIAVVQ